MKPQRKITPSNRGKHLGHALEGHCRGLFRRLAVQWGCEVVRSFPVPGFPVESDIVLLDENQRVKLLAIVAYNSDSVESSRKLDHSTHKFYRTRLEYQLVRRAIQEQPTNFTRDFLPIVVVYGSGTSWKPQLLQELAAQCPPFLFLPDQLGTSKTQTILDDVFDIYCQAWQGRRKDARQAVEEYFAAMPSLPLHHLAVFRLFAATAASTDSRAAFRRRPPLAISPVLEQTQPQPFRSRLRQGLSMASLFPDEELLAWRNYSPGPKPLSRELDSFVRRGLLLDLVELELRQDLRRRTWVDIAPRRPYQDNPVTRGQDYLPHRPDFSDWATIAEDSLIGILDQHRALPAGNEAFTAGGLDQAAGNWPLFCRLMCMVGRELLAALGKGDPRALSLALQDPQLLKPEGWHPCAATAGFCFAWSIGVATIATIRQSREEIRRYELRVPRVYAALAKYLAEQLCREAPAAISLLMQLGTFTEALASEPLLKVAQLGQPVLLSLDIPTSWSAAVYLAATTNPSHNPLAVALVKWLKEHFPTASWKGYPTSRGVRVASLLDHATIRIEWTVGARVDGSIVLGECRSITSNNLGNKSKELYDRIGQTRAAAEECQVPIHMIGVLDGDFHEGALAELTSRIGYDCVIPARDILNCGRAARGRTAEL
jgi:hypothetical protein